MKKNELFIFKFIFFILAAGFFSSCTNPLGSGSSLDSNYLSSHASIDLSQSTLSSSPSSLPPDGVTTSTLTVTLRNSAGQIYVGKSVTLNSSRGASDIILPAAAITNASGIATFTVKSSSAGVSIYSVTDSTDSATLPVTTSLLYTNPFVAQSGVAGYTTYAYAIAVDGSGNTYAGGFTSGNLVSGSGAATGTQDYFLAKYNSSGVQQWVKQVGLAGKIAKILSIASDSSGNTCVTGSSNGALATGFTSSGNYDFFIARYDSSGNLKWTQQLATAASGLYSSGTIGSMTVAMDSLGNCIAGGPTTTNLVSGGSSIGNYDFFITKYNSLGTQMWINEFGESGKYSVGYQVALDNIGNIYFSGRTTGNLVTGSGSATGTYDLALMKLNSATGSLIWTQQLGFSGYYVYSQGTATDSLGNIYVSGYTNANIVTGSGGSTGTADAFLIQFNSAGAVNWVKQLGVTSYLSTGRQVAVDSANNVYISGYTYGNLVSGSGASTGNNDAMIVKFDSTGNQKWIQQFGIAGVTTDGFSSTADSFGNIYFTGMTAGNMITLSGASTGLYDYYLVSCNYNGICR